MSTFSQNLCLAFRVNSRKVYVWTQNLGQLMLKLRDKLAFNPLALELDLYSLAHHLCKM